MKILKDNYENLITDISNIAKELGLEEDGTIDEIYAEIKKKDKIIDLMAEYIARGDIEEDICIEKLDECDSMALGECENCIKQYFERRVKNGFR